MFILFLHSMLQCAEWKTSSCCLSQSLFVKNYDFKLCLQFTFKINLYIKYVKFYPFWLLLMCSMGYRRARSMIMFWGLYLNCQHAVIKQSRAKSTHMLVLSAGWQEGYVIATTHMLKPYSVLELSYLYGGSFRYRLH